ncbi:hypothetical protein N182_35985 [Sinorhizobium sp. GL2]|nr:hypothetical protein N182_35985 [Sinorhizobium sp. GL2]
MQVLLIVKTGQGFLYPNEMASGRWVPHFWALTLRTQENIIGTSTAMRPPT